MRRPHSASISITCRRGGGMSAASATAEALLASVEARRRASTALALASRRCALRRMRIASACASRSALELRSMRIGADMEKECWRVWKKCVRVRHALWGHKNTALRFFVCISHRPSLPWRDGLMLDALLGGCLWCTRRGMGEHEKKKSDVRVQQGKGGREKQKKEQCSKSVFRFFCNGSFSRRPPPPLRCLGRVTRRTWSLRRLQEVLPPPMCTWHPSHSWCATVAWTVDSAPATAC